MTYNVTTTQMTVFIVLAIWELIWKGVALWRAAYRNERYWFVALLLINSAGVLPILYMLSTEFRENKGDQLSFKAAIPHRR